MGLTDKQLAMRRTGIGASECAAAASLHPYMDAWSLWLSKIHGHTPIENNAMRAGNFLEPGVAKMYQAELGPSTRLRRCATRRHRTHRWMLATIDREVIVDGKRDRIAELKLPGSRYLFNKLTGERELEWGYGPDEIPAYIACQVQWQIETTGFDRCDVVAFFLDSRELAIYPQTRNQQMIDSLIQINERFWKDHILTQTPPPIDGSLSAGTYLRQRYPTNTGGTITGTPIDEAVARTYAIARRDEKDAKARKDAAGNLLRSAIGYHDGVIDHWGKAMWKTERGDVNYKALAADLRGRVELLAQAAGHPEMATDLDELAEQHRAQSERTLRVTYKLPLEEPADDTLTVPQLTVLNGGAA